MKLPKPLLILSFVLFTLLPISSFASTFYIPQLEESFYWEDEHQVIAHALGRIDGINYTNCLEAFKQNYEKGFRVFEVDMALSTDDQLVFLHDWNTFWGLTIGKGILGGATSFERYNAQQIQGKYTTLSVFDLLTLLKNHSDMYLVTDTKTIEPELFKLQMRRLLEAAQQIDSTIIDRLIIQVYDEATATALEEVYPFKNVIYTLYTSPDRYDAQKVKATLLKHNYRVLTMPSSLVNDALLKMAQECNVKVFTHTVNTTDEVVKQQAKGIYGFYTDWLMPSTITYANHPLLSQNVSLRINDHFVSTPVPAYISEGTTFIPLHLIPEHLDIILYYEPQTKKITLKGEHVLELTLDSTLAYVDGFPTTLTLAPFILEGTTMVPIRFIAEALNLQVDWDEAQKVISIRSATYIPLF
ncbi:hypothetical protein CS063_07020 [Sporanaerobium hydrogeniformans]|uniref:Uncharacterized protein n=1 Tax=Sporanaerobium hydrogeniformans TaxID=3072179 RepID=A0AC61DEC8_9FIRM|nr:stalk domain-containing protein [Sporanaerobium hydrogeniformans]PHV71076.1 hypothetical protein CS063_07020 [Sporanaerobium hydrogeniformans]